MNSRARISTFTENASDVRWLKDVAVLFTCLAVLSAIFWHESSGAVRVWLDSPTFNHCFLIVPIALFMMWECRDEAAPLPRTPSLLATLLLLPLSFAWLVTFYASVLELQQFVVMTMLQIMLLSVLGWPVYRRYIAPFLYLYFLVPFGAEFVPLLQQVTAHFAVVCLHLIGIPVFSDGAIIEIPAGSFAVAEACAGLRFLIAAIAFGVFFATQIYRSIWRRLIFIALSIGIPIVANGLRVFGLIAAAQWLGNPTAALADHLIYGWIFFSLILVVLIFVGRAFSDKDEDVQPSNASTSKPGNSKRVLQTLALSAICAAIFPFSTLFLGQFENLPLPLATLSVALPWLRSDDDGSWQPVVAHPSKVFRDSFSDGQRRIYRFVALYDGGDNVNLLKSENRLADEHQWKYNSSRLTQISVAGRDLTVMQTKIENGARRLTIWSFYSVAGQPQVSTLAVKLSQLRQRLLGGRCLSALVAVATSDENPYEIAQFLSASQPLPSYLCDDQRTRTNVSALAKGQ